MGDSLKCPSCCDKVFDSKAQLIEHLAHLLGDISCPICNSKWSSIGHLVEHLTLESCSQNSIYNTEAYSHAVDTQLSDSQAEEINKPKLDLPDDDPLSKENPEMTSEDANYGKMYIEFLSKQLTRPCLQTQEVKLIKDNGVSRYVFVTDDEEPSLDDNSTIVTKQNNDGTISLTSVKDMALESDTLITQESEMGNDHQEIYSCNTCGVSFTSVLDHIQIYHNDQDVVVEEPIGEDCESRLENLKPLSEDGSAHKEESHTNGFHAGRRMITDTGDIVEAPLLNASPVLDSINTTTNCKTETIFYTIDDLKDAMNTSENVGVGANNKQPEEILPDIKDTKKPNKSDTSKSGSYHKVVIKELTMGTGQKVRMYQCITCQAHVNNLDDFKTRPCKPRRLAKYQCSYCLVIYANAKSLNAHMKSHKEKAGPGTPAVVPMNNKPVTYGCEVCLTVFTTNKSLKLHKRMHDPIRERPIEPPVETAEGRVGSGDKFLCSVCLKLIPIDYRTIHQNSHKNIEKFNCDTCNKKFSSKEYLEMHMNVHNFDKISVGKQDESLPYLCVYCDRRFARPHEKVKHERIHTGEKPHSCEICGKSFRVSYCLTLHMRTHTGARPYACPHCGKRFKAHSVYNHHMLTHSDVRAYKCPYCPKAFKTSVQLAGHKNSHTKPFSCQHCNRPFASLYAVRVHTETHTRQNNLKFSCTVCGASYARAFALKDHVRQAHTKDEKDGEEVIMEILTSNELPVVP